MTNWAQLALKQPVTDVGQISKSDKKHLDKLVKQGILLRVENLSYPKPKVTWVGYDYLGVLPGPLENKK